MEPLVTGKKVAHFTSALTQVNHARPSDVTEGYSVDWTVGQLRELTQRIADRIDELSSVACARVDG